MKYKNYALFCLVIFLVLIITGCDSLKIGWVATNLPGHSKAKYFYYSGETARSFKVSAGDIVIINYDYKNKKGALEIKFITPDKKEIILSDKNPGKEELKINKDGKIKIIIKGNKTKGNFDIKWEIK